MIKKIIIFFLFTANLIYAEMTSTNFVVQPRIINGTEVSSYDDTWRFIVALKYSGNQYCGGSLISSHWILTAAHCVYSTKTNSAEPVTDQDSVGIGSYNLNSMTNYKIKRFIVHPSFDYDTLDNDIALVELSDDITTIEPIIFDTSHTLTTGTQTKVAGWGTMSTTSNLYPDDLREALTPIVDFNQCNNNYYGELTNNMLCAGYFVSTRDTCYGDSGGPLIVDNTLVGIVSWGYSCALDDYPGVYTKVQNYADWIGLYVPKQIDPIIMPSSIPITNNWIPIIIDNNTMIFVPKLQ